MNTSIPIISCDAFNGRIAGVICGEDCRPDDPSTNEAGESEQSCPPMLQWTTRLQDFLEDKGFETDPRTWQDLREAEFICHVSQSKTKESPRKRKSSSTERSPSTTATDSATFPQEFDFYLFWGCFNRIAYLPLDIFPRESGLHHGKWYHPYSNHGKPVDWFQRDVSLIWLSPTVFISNAEISWTSPVEKRRTLLWLYTVTLEMRPAYGSHGIHSIYIYCLEYFRKSKRNKPPPPPLLPLSFFRQMVSRLPVDFFTSITFLEGPPEFSPSFYSAFLASVLPTTEDACPPIKPMNYQEYTEVRFPGKMTFSMLRATLQHSFHPYVRLVLGQLGFDRLEGTSIDAKRVNLMLRHDSPDLRHLKIPKFLVKFVPDEEDDSFAANPRLETLTMDWTSVKLARDWQNPPRDWNDAGVSPAILDGIRKNPNFQRLNLRFDLPEWVMGDEYFPQCAPSIQRNLVDLLGHVIPGHPSFKELTVNFLVCNGQYEVLCAPGTERLFSHAKFLGSSLCHLSIIHEYQHNSSMGRRRHEPGRAPIEMKNLPLWDQLVAPRLAMNWLFLQTKHEQRHEPPMWALSKKPAQRAKRAGRQPASSLLALQIQAINEGVMYRKTTEQLPHDMRPANATVTHVLVHRVLVAVEGAAVL
jgi:hypothetical protein